MSSFGETALERVRVLVLDALRDVEGTVVLFGSRAAGAQHLHSDIDVGFLPRGPGPGRALALLRERLENLDIPYSVDVVDLSRTSEDFRRTALNGAIIWRN